MNISIVLVEPQGPLNIGSVCRAMLNFGLTELRLVNPAADNLSDEARQMAVKATTLLERAVLYDNLNDALADCHFSMGTTRRFGKYREGLLAPDQAAMELLPLSRQGKVSLIFGREDHGLFTKELDLCQGLITIPTHDDFPSMNLSQAVTLCLYELHKAKKSEQSLSPSVRKLAEGEKIEEMMQHMRRTLVDIEYLDRQNPDHILRSFRKIFSRAGLNEREVRILHGLWSRIDWIESERRKLSP